MSADSASVPECTGNCSAAAELEAENHALNAKIVELEEQLAAERAHRKRLQRQLRQHENGLTPSSKQRGTTTSNNGGSDETATDDRDDEQTTLDGAEDEQQKPGRKKGHEGTTRSEPDPDRTVVVHETSCEHCGSELGDPDDTTSRTIEDIPDPEDTEAVEYEIGHYECDCGETTVATHEDLPSEGDFGHNVLVQTTLLKFDQRVTYGRMQEFYEAAFELELSTGSLYSFTKRVAEQLRPVYEEIRQEIREADVVYVDETGMSLDGEQGWIWSASTETEVLYTVREDRSQQSIEYLLGEDFEGRITCDGWRSYGAYTSELQRCWSHLRVKSEFVADKHKEAEPINAELKQLYADLLAFLETGPPPPERAQRRAEARAVLEALAETDAEHDEVQQLTTYIENGLGHWLPFVTDPAVEPTNNRAERALRKVVTLRKIMGALRSEDGQVILETVMTAIETWKARDQNPRDEMLKVLRDS